MQIKSLFLNLHFSAAVEIQYCLKDQHIEVYGFTSPAELVKVIEQHCDTDIVIDINFHEEIFQRCIQYGKRYIVWSFDTGVSRNITSGMLRDSDCLFLFNHVDYLTLKKIHSNTWYLPFSAGNNFIRNPKTTGFNHSLLLIMNSYHDVIEESHSEFEKFIRSVNEPQQLELLKLIRDIMDLAVDKHLPILNEDRFIEIIDELIADCGFDPFVNNSELKTRLSNSYSQILSSLQRESLINTLSSVSTVHLYGDEYWRNALNSCQNVNFNGMANYPDLPSLYNAAKININLTQIQNLDSIAQRVFHVLAAGGFLLTNPFNEHYSPFVDGEHYVAFSSLDDLVEKANYYLKHDDERIKIASAGHDVFKEHHTMAKRLQFIFDRVLAKDS